VRSGLADCRVGAGRSILSMDAASEAGRSCRQRRQYAVRREWDLPQTRAGGVKYSIPDSRSNQRDDALARPKWRLVRAVDQDRLRAYGQIIRSV
jgi:hypothetical protein